MADFNQVTLVGRLTRDPELRATPSGQPVAQIGLAVGHKYKGQDGVLREETAFIEISCWGKLAETVSRYMKKGRQILVSGRLKFDSWDDKQTGQKRSKLYVVAEQVQFLDRREDGGGSGYQEPGGHDESTTGEWAPPAVEKPVNNRTNPPVKSSPPPSQPTGWEPPDMGEPPF